jgi:hypothetical protein
MNALQIILIFIVSLSGYPLGLLLAEFTQDELKSGRLFFKIILSVSILALIAGFFFLKDTNLIFFIAIIIFMFLMTLASFIKSKKLKK